MQESYACCLYETNHADFCLLIDQECINEYDEHQENFFATTGIVFSVLLLLVVILFMYCYKKNKRKKNEENLMKSKESELILVLSKAEN